MPKFTTSLRRRQLDESLLSLRGINRPQRGYIHEIRAALEMTTYELAERMGVSQPTVMNLERNESNGTISLRSLEKAASALGCRLVYGLLPETSLEEMVQIQARTRARELSQAIFRTMALEKQKTNQKEMEKLIEELAQEVLRKGKRELWKHDK